MVKKKCDIWLYFENKTIKNKSVYQCNYCGQRYSKNATRLIEHITKCSKCPELIKKKFSPNMSRKSKPQGKCLMS